MEEEDCIDDMVEKLREVSDIESGVVRLNKEVQNLCALAGEVTECRKGAGAYRLFNL